MKKPAFKKLLKSIDEVRKLGGCKCGHSKVIHGKYGCLLAVRSGPFNAKLCPCKKYRVGGGRRK